MEIVINNLQKKISLNIRKIHRLIKAILECQGVDNNSNLSFVFVTHQKIRALHKKFLHIDRATDVITFDLKDALEFKKKKLLIGEIIISVDEAKVNCKYYQNSYEEELALYCVHGVLHLCGYDDHNQADIKRMRAREKKVLSAVASSIKGIAPQQ